MEIKIMYIGTNFHIGASIVYIHSSLRSIKKDLNKNN